MRGEWVGSVEASRIIGVPYSTFMRWVDKGLIEPVHKNPGVTGAKVFRRSEVEKLSPASVRAALRARLEEAEAAS